MTLAFFAVTSQAEIDILIWVMFSPTIDISKKNQESSNIKSYTTSAAVNGIVNLAPDVPLMTYIVNVVKVVTTAKLVKGKTVCRFFL